MGMTTHKLILSTIGQPAPELCVVEGHSKKGLSYREDSQLMIAVAPRDGEQWVVLQRTMAGYRVEVRRLGEGADEARSRRETSQLPQGISNGEINGKRSKNPGFERKRGKSRGPFA